MTEPLLPGNGTPVAPPAAARSSGVLAPTAFSAASLPAQLREIILAVDGVTTVYPARPLWQTIAGAARSALGGATPSPVDVTEAGTGTAVTTVKARIGVSGAYPAPDVARAVAAAVRQHFSPQPVSVEVAIVHIGGDQIGTN
ncbi:hypothetical protein [Arthrobacter sp. H-02-3]|uniref:hypothetical protein n=1 Tax=Arthrobacter sp. H-02-3 TaxID=2703675 RepID=UPI001F3020EA|nr:hypothetical protein [Arthrobacter sp. H-02-3]